MRKTNHKTGGAEGAKNGGGRRRRGLRVSSYQRLGAVRSEGEVEMESSVGHWTGYGGRGAGGLGHGGGLGGGG